MRVLILSALIALAAAAPAEEVAAPTPAVSDEAAPIDAKILAEDQAQYAADQAQLAEDQARMSREEKAFQADSLSKEQAEETVWANEEKKWQAVDAVQTAEAQIDGAVARDSPMLARAAFGYVPAPIVPAPIVPHVVPAPAYPAPAFYSTPIFAPTLKIAEAKDEKMAEPMKAAEPAKEEKPVFAQPLLAAPLAYPTLKVATPWTAPIAPVAPVAPLAYPYYQTPVVAPYLRHW